MIKEIYKLKILMIFLNKQIKTKIIKILVSKINLFQLKNRIKVKYLKIIQMKKKATKKKIKIHQI